MKERTTWGDQISVNKKGRTLFSKVVLYLKLCIEDNGGRGGVMQGQQSLILIEARLSSCKFIICKSLGDLHHLLARRPVNILRNLFFSKGDYSKVRRQPPKSTGQSCIPIGQR